MTGRLGSVEQIAGASLDIMVSHAVHADGFRVWLYPGVPNDYTLNPSAGKLAEQGATLGMSVVQIACEVIRKHGDRDYMPKSPYYPPHKVRTARLEVER